MSYLSKITREFANAVAAERDIEQRAWRAADRAVRRAVQREIGERATVARARRTAPTRLARVDNPATLRFRYAPDVAVQLRKDTP